MNMQKMQMCRVMFFLDPSQSSLCVCAKRNRGEVKSGTREGVGGNVYD